MNIGINESSREIYTGQGTQGKALSVDVLISPCKLVTSKSEIHSGSVAKSSYHELLFREDFYDPKTRIRRGRVYKAWNSQPHTWRSENQAVYGSCRTYGSHSLWAEYMREGNNSVYALLGDERRFTVWRLISIEVNAMGEEVITIRGLSSLGLLPEFLDSEIDDQALPLVQDMLDAVINEMYTTTADSMVDHCREAAVAIIGACIDQPGKDLGKLASALQQNELSIAANCASTIARFHSRRKSSEIRSRNLRRLTDEDAQLAVYCLGTIMVELGCGRW